MIMNIERVASMTIKSSFAITAGRFLYWYLHTFMKGGSSLPGKIATKFDPAVLKQLTKNYDVIIITGTNGKTLTTALTVQTLKQKYDHIMTNSTGSNMMQGVTTAFLADHPQKGQRQLAVLEVDEANVEPLCHYITPKAIVMTNIFRDQMDRFGEIYTTYNMILAGVKLVPEATLIMNADLPLFSSVELPNPKIYYGFNHLSDGEMMAPSNTDGVLCPVCKHIIHYKFISYASQGKFYCPNCGYQRPELDEAVTAITQMRPTNSQFEINHEPFEISIGGMYNIYNALAAYSVGRFFDIPVNAIQKAFTEDKRIFGRQEVIQLKDKAVTLVLVKNPVGLNQVLQMISSDPEDFSLAMLLNANYADGIDTSWIWDGEFENLLKHNIPSVITGGQRGDDIAFRLKVAGVPTEQLHETKTLDATVAAIEAAPTKHVYVLATYTAVLQLRKKLATANYIKKGLSV